MTTRDLLPTVCVCVAATSLVIAACGAGDQAHRNAHSPRAATVERPPPAAPPVRLDVTNGSPLERPARTRLAHASQRFAVTLVRWLYGDRQSMTVEPIDVTLRRQLADAPPYVPADVIGSGDGQVIGVRVFVQTSQSAVLVVAVSDSRTSYSIPATVERRRGRWVVVRLNTH